jgi:hypothetical protein
MKYGSLQNHIYSRSTLGQPEPEVGMGATILMYSDRHAGTIIKVERKNKKLYIEVQEDHATRTDNYGMSDCQSYSYAPNPKGEKNLFRFNEKNQKWERVYVNPETSRFCKDNSCGLIIGKRMEYYDYSF